MHYWTTTVFKWDTIQFEKLIIIVNVLPTTVIGLATALLSSRRRVVAAAVLRVRCNYQLVRFPAVCLEQLIVP